LQSDNGREFVAGIITEMVALWPDVVLVNGRPRYPQSQGSVENANGTLKNSLIAWMRDNETSKWTSGLPFVQWGINVSYHEAIKMSPYEAMFGQKSRMGLTSSIPREFLEKLTPGMFEEDLMDMLTADNLEESLTVIPASDVSLPPPCGTG